METIQKLKEAVSNSKFMAAAISVGAGLAVAVSGLADDSPAQDDVADAMQHPADAEAPNQVQKQIETNTNKLDALSEADTEGETNYQLLGC